MSAAALVSRLAKEGIDQELLAEIAHELFTAEVERKALADRRQNERVRKARSRDSTGCHGKSRERRGHPPKEVISNPPVSEANASAGGSPADPMKQLFDVGVSLLTGAGKTETQARSMVGKWRKEHGEAKVLAAFLDCRGKAISEPLEWLQRRLKTAKWVSKSGYEYRGDDEAVMREANKRNDMDTYWRVKASLKQAA